MSLDMTAGDIGIALLVFLAVGGVAYWAADKWLRRRRLNRWAEQYRTEAEKLARKRRGL